MTHQEPNPNPPKFQLKNDVELPASTLPNSDEMIFVRDKQKVKEYLLYKLTKKLTKCSPHLSIFSQIFYESTHWAVYLLDQLTDMLSQYTG